MNRRQKQLAREQIVATLQHHEAILISEQDEPNSVFRGLGESELIDICCDQFELEFRQGNQPDVEVFVDKLPQAIRPQLLCELLSLENELAGGGAMSDKLSRYILKFPEYETVIRDALELGTLHETLPPQKKITDLIYENSPPPTQIGNYDLLQVIGEGGMGTVWMAEQKEPVRRKVALKIVKAGLDSEQVISRFEAERQALAVMDHPGIARIIDAGTTENGAPFFAMELVKGTPITKYCDEHCLDLHSRLKLFVQVCAAVQHAHQKGIIHRDLKPSNILVTDEDGQPVSKIIDFGLAKALDVKQKLTDRSLFTEFGQILGTLKYMSPEQAQMDSVDVDTRSDIYSLGVILYELLTGSNPLDDDSFPEKTFLQVLEWIREKESVRPSVRLAKTRQDLLTSITDKRQTDAKHLAKILIGDLDWIVLRALDKARDRRYDSANGLAEDILRFLSNDPVSARPPTASYRISKFVRKNRSLVFTSSLLFLAILLGMAGTIGFAFQANHSKNEAVERRKFAEATLERERKVLLESVQLSEQLADLYLNAGERELALPLFEKALERSKGILGLNNETTLAQMNSVAFLYGLTGRLDAALPLMEQLEEVSVLVKGADHINTLSAKSNLAAMYLRFDRVDDAIPLFEQVYQQRKQALDPDDFDLRVSYRWLVIVYSMTENWSAAQPVVVDWLAQLERAGEKRSPEYAWAMTSRAEIEYGLNDFKGALATANQVAILAAAQPVDRARANNIAAASLIHLDQVELGAHQNSLSQLESSYLELKSLLDTLPGFKQYFVINAIKRNGEIFTFLEVAKAAELWQQELAEVQSYLKGSPAPLHPGIPHFDPQTGKETPRFEKKK